MKMGIVGAGNMAAAMARGWSRAGGEPEAILLSDSGSGRAQALASELGGEAVIGNVELAERADLVVLAMKPAGLESVAPEVSPAGKPVISVLGATSLQRLRAALPGLPVVRAMPNIAVEVGRGVICWAASEEVDGRTRGEVESLLGLLGRAVEIEDGLIDPATAVMGCSPAYLALVVETLIDSAVEEGIAAETASELVLEALAGTAVALEERDPAELRDAVASPGGSTEAGLAVLEREAVGSAIAGAVNASLERMRS